MENLGKLYYKMVEEQQQSVIINSKLIRKEIFELIKDKFSDIKESLDLYDLILEFEDSVANDVNNDWQKNIQETYKGLFEGALSAASRALASSIDQNTSGENE